MTVATKHVTKIIWKVIVTLSLVNPGVAVLRALFIQKFLINASNTVLVSIIIILTTLGTNGKINAWIVFVTSKEELSVKKMDAILTSKTIYKSIYCNENADSF